jgi:hypothetical protein
MATSLKDDSWLRWIEQLVSSRVPAHVGPEPCHSSFHCRLEEQPDHLVPGHYLRDQADTVLSGQPLFLNPNCWFVQNGELPNEMDGIAHFWLGSTPEGQNMLWIKDPSRGTTMPFWLNSDLANCLSGLSTTDPVPATLLLEARRFLSSAEVLVPADWIATSSQRWSEVIFHTREAFRLRGFAPVRQLIHPFHISGLRSYYRSLIRTGQMRLGDLHNPRRYVANNEPVASFFHHQLTQAVSALFGEPVKPSYVYVASYQEGADLKKHTDREQCAFSVTYCLDYSPEPQLATPWPIQLHTPSGKTTVFQAIGDGLLYLGCEIPHSRALLPPGHTSTSIFFHYVAKHFNGPLN